MDNEKLVVRPTAIRGQLLGVWVDTDQASSSKLAAIKQQRKVLDFIDGKTQRKEQAPAGTPCFQHIGLFLVTLTLMTSCAGAQTKPAAQPTTVPNENEALKVNWLYGAFVPRTVPMKPLTPRERWKLYLRTTYTTYGIYIKTGLFTLSDQVRNTPPEWGKTPEGFGKRLGTREAQFVIQNSLTAAGNAALGWEPRYDRCRCAGFWPRTWHAINRNFVTYGGPGQSIRPQIMPYAGAFGAAAVSASWQPNNPSVLVKGYQGAVTQVAVGIGVNWLAEFAPEFKRVLRRPPGPE